MTEHQPEASPVALARAHARAGRMAEAASVVGELLQTELGLAASDLRINTDIYSLNSLNGTFTAGGDPLFFKFHQEENEGAMAGEYYRARLLAEAGLPVDQPLHASTDPGRQILVYRRRIDPRFADVLRDLDLSGDPAGIARALAVEKALNERLIEVYRQTLHAITPEQSAAEPIHRLFHERLVTPGQPGAPGGRLASFYLDKPFSLPGLEIDWAELSGLRFVVNGTAYDRTLGQLFSEALVRLEPRLLAACGGVTAHGDAHNANVWKERQAGGEARLVMFDPAFAGSHVPALLAEIKTTFHNVLAHPLWLYEPDLAATRYQATVRREGGSLHVDTDWQPSQVRKGLLDLKRDLVWRPLLALLAGRGMLPADWRRIVRLALFLCPTLVMSLRAGPGAGPHNPVSSAIGLATAISVGAEPSRPDLVSDLLDAIDPEP